jgi:hypothetical protein
MEERGLVGLEARGGDGGEVIGRIIRVLADEESGELTHVVVETDGEEQVELPITAIQLDPEADFATFDADPSDVEPGDHVGDEEDSTQGYAPNRALGPEDGAHEGQFVTTPEDPDEAQSPEEADRESAQAGGYEDEGSNPVDSGYPRNDAYIDPDTGEERERYTDGEGGTRTGVEALLDGTGLRLRDIVEGLVELEGSIGSEEDLDSLVSDISDIDEVVDVDTTDVTVG